MRFKVSLAEQLALRIASAAGQITMARAKAAQQVMRELAEDTHNKAQEMAGQRLNSTRQKYIDNLSFDQVGDNHWALTLNADAAYLEEGYSTFDMIKAGLTRGPKSKMSKKGHRYVSIPFEHAQAPGKSNHPQHDVPVQRGQQSETTKGNLAKDLMRLKQSFGLKGTFKDQNGNPIYGKVFTVTKNPLGPMWNYSDVLGNKDTAIMEGKEIHKNLAGLTGIQYKAGSKTKTAYMTWRTASENPESAGKWIHPGFDGAKIFPDLEQWAVQRIGQKLRDIFEG